MMSALAAAVAANREAVAAFIAAARGVPPTAWAVPRGPGKWSPAQITLHVTLAYEGTDHIVLGTWAGSRLPALVRPLIRRAYFAPVLRRHGFRPGLRAPGPFQPPLTDTPVELLSTRLDAAALAVEQGFTAREHAGSLTLNHPVFGTLSLADYLRFQSIHTHHHRGQLTAPVDT
jgi:hypothetical protein